MNPQRSYHNLKTTSGKSDRACRPNILQILSSIICSCFILILSVSTVHGENGTNQEKDSPTKRNPFTIFGVPQFLTDGDLVVGLGPGYATKPFKDVDNSVFLAPNFAYQNGGFFIENNLVGYSIYNRNLFSITLLGSLHTPEFDPDDSDYLKGMDEDHITFEAGAALTVDTDLGEFGISALADLTGTHNGQIFVAKYSFPLSGKIWQLDPHIGLTYQTKKMVDYYYGVSDSEQRQNRQQYSGRGAINPFVGITGGIKISERVFVAATLEYTYFGEGITDSPLIEDTYAFDANLTLNYVFF